MDSTRRKTIQINFAEVPPKLKELVLRVPESSSFNKRYSHLLSLVTTGFNKGILSNVVQFYDPMYHCFTFPDYHLMPTLEEYSYCDTVGRTDFFFGMLVCVLRLFLQNVAVSKSRH